MSYADEPENPNENAGISAVSNATGGNFTALCERLRDPSVTLTMFEREWLARRIEPRGRGKDGRPKRDQEAVAAFVWLTEAEGMTKTKAYDAVWIAEGKRRRFDTVQREIRDDLRNGFRPDFGLWLSIERWKNGCRDDEFRPQLLQSK